jgi:hypothetical protein
MNSLKRRTEKDKKDKYWSTKHYTRKPKIDPDEFHQLKFSVLRFKEFIIISSNVPQSMKSVKA